ncbi:MAG: BPSL0067 family protein [Pseudomonadota bacterium]
MEKISYAYTQDVVLLHKTPKVGTWQCVALVQHYANAPATVWWAPGEDVLGNQLIQPGTAIATFEDGVYKNLPHGNHAALFVKHDGQGFWILDQWTNKQEVSMRLIRRKGKDQYGKWKDASNNADAFSIIEHK